MTRHFLRAAAVFLTLLSVAASTSFPSAADTSQRAMNDDLSRFESAARPNIVIQIVAADTTFPMRIGRDEFESILVETGADFVFRINAKWAIQDLVLLIKSKSFEVVGGDEAFDLRYKLELRDNKDTVLVLYADRFGGLLYRDQALKPRRNRAWFRTFIDQLPISE